MTFGLTADGFKIKRLEDILSEVRQRFQNEFGASFDVDDATPEGQIIAIMAERESLIWELAQDVYNSQYPNSSEGVQLDNVAALTGTTRNGPRFSNVSDGVARGTSGTVVPAGTIISVSGNPSARFITQADTTINIADGATFKSGPIELVAETAGPVQANTGTLTVIETPVSGMNSFTNESDANLGSATETDPELKARRDQELQIAGSATVEAIISELSERELVTAVRVFVNRSNITDSEGKPPKSIEVVVLGDNDADLAQAIFEVIGAGEGTFGDISETVTDSQGFTHIISFSRPTEVDIHLIANITKDSSLYPADGDDQVSAAFLAFGNELTVGEDVIVYGSDPLICAVKDIPGILDIELLIGTSASPTTDDNIVIADDEISSWDSSRITVNS